jgi:hypothetical protein
MRTSVLHVQCVCVSNMLPTSSLRRAQVYVKESEIFPGEFWFTEMVINIYDCTLCLVFSYYEYQCLIHLRTHATFLNKIYTLSAFIQMFNLLCLIIK